MSVHRQYVEIGLGDKPNANLQGYSNGGNYQQGNTQLTVQGVPFRLELLNQAPGTTGVIQTPANGLTNTFTFVLPPGIRATALYTLINSTYGAPAVNEGSVVVTGARGETFIVNLIEGVNIRDHNNGVYVNTFSDPTLVPTYFVNQVPNSVSGQVRLDRQVMNLPSAFNGDTVASITFSGIGNGNPNGLPFLAAMTLETYPLLSIAPTTTNTVAISWPWPSTGWALRQNTNLDGTVWIAPIESVSNDGTNNFILVNLPIGQRFYRLQKP